MSHDNSGWNNKPGEHPDDLPATATQSHQEERKEQLTIDPDTMIIAMSKAIEERSNFVSASKHYKRSKRPKRTAKH
jgi:hypothetical protein